MGLFILLIITKPSLGQLILDLMMLVLRAWMEELDVWDLAMHAALHLLPAAAAARVNKLGFLNDGMCTCQELCMMCTSILHSC